MENRRLPDGCSGETQGRAEGAAAKRGRYRIGEWVFDLSQQVLQREDEKRPLMPKVARLLEHLAAAVPDPLTRDQLLDLLWPKVVVGDHALHELVSQLRKQLGDDARAPRYISTLAKRGYQLISPVSPISGSPPLGKAVPPGRSVCIVPMAGDPAIAAGDGHTLAHALIERFVRLPELQLILADSEDQAASAAYTLQVHLSSRTDVMSARGHLVRAVDRHLVWAESFAATERGPTAAAQLAQQIARRARLRLVCDSQCQSIRARARNAEAAELTCAAVTMNYQINQAGAFDPKLMRAQAERAVRLDPALLEAWQMLPIAYLWLAKLGEVPIGQATEQCHAALSKAFALGPDDAYTHWLLGTVYVNLQNDPDAAEESLSRAIARDPLHPNAHWFHGMLGMVHRQRGDLSRALEAHGRAVRIFDSDGRIQAEYAEVLHFAGHHERAVEAAATALSLEPFPPSVVFATLAGFRANMALGRRDEARAWLDRFLATAEPGYHHHAAYMLAALGCEAEARAMLGILREGPSLQGYTLVLAHLGLGDVPAAIATARYRRAEEANSLITRVKIDPALAPVSESLGMA